AARALRILRVRGERLGGPIISRRIGSGSNIRVGRRAELRRELIRIVRERGARTARGRRQEPNQPCVAHCAADLQRACHASRSNVVCAASRSSPSAGLASVQSWPCRSCVTELGRPCLHDRSEPPWNGSSLLQRLFQSSTEVVGSSAWGSS